MLSKSSAGTGALVIPVPECLDGVQNKDHVGFELVQPGTWISRLQFDRVEPAFIKHWIKVSARYSARSIGMNCCVAQSASMATRISGFQLLPQTSSLP